MQPTLDDLLFTLRICQDALPPEIHPDHYERLLEIQKIIKTHFANEERNQQDPDAKDEAKPSAHSRDD